MADTLRVAFLGCGFITGVHSRNLARLRGSISCSYASRDAARAVEFCRVHQGTASFDSYDRAIGDPTVDAVVIAVPPTFHLPLTLQALAAGKHVVVEKPAFLRMEDYLAVCEARDRAGRVVLVGENDHYKPLAITLRRLLTEGRIGRMVFAHFTTMAKRLKTADDWRNDESMAGGDAFFEEGIHWLHIAGSLGPRIVPSSVRGYRPPPSDGGPDRRAKSMLVAFQYDNGAAGSLYYSREIPSLLKGLRLSKIFGRQGIITFESNGAFLLARGGGCPRLIFPGFRDMRGYQAMYRDFYRAVRDGTQPEMSLERAMEDQRLMDAVYATVNTDPTDFTDMSNGSDGAGPPRFRVNP
jgi:predicted dehydrogenase